MMLQAHQNLGLSAMILFGSLFGIVDSGITQTFHGQLSLWGTTQQLENNSTSQGLGLRYLPEFTYNFTTQSSYLIDTELSANVYGNYSSATEDFAGDLKPYRAWLRFATHRFESRIGLQKINFGPAKLLRSEMWFDRLDPRDPLQLTDGVYALRLRYDFENLSNIWMWGIYGEDETKGLEVLPSKSGSIEFGGRYQHPVGTGEMAMTFHHRTVNEGSLPFYSTPDPYTGEDRFALDGIWDVGVGLWFESALVHTATTFDFLKWQSFLTVGSDYTFSIANGLHVLAEHMLVTMSDKPFDTNEKTQITGASVSYPVTWLDQITYFAIYNWDADMSYHYLGWQRTYDRWIFYAAVFGRTGEASNSMLFNQPVTTVGKLGVQLMVIFNH